MDRITLQQRLKELYAQISRDSENCMPKGLKEYMDGLREDLNFSTLERFASQYGFIPVAFFRESDEQVEDLGVTGFMSGEIVKNYIGRVFEKYRKMSNKEQQEVAMLVGMPPANICRYESGASNPRISKLNAISRVLLLYPAYLLKPFPLSA